MLDKRPTLERQLSCPSSSESEDEDLDYLLFLSLADSEDEEESSTDNTEDYMGIEEYLDTTAASDTSASEDIISETSDDEEEENEWKFLVMEKYIPLATPTNVIVLDHPMNHHQLNLIMEKAVNWRNLDDIEINSYGPDCHLCGKLASDECHFVLYDDIRYRVIYENFNDLSGYEECNDLSGWVEEFKETVGFLQCCYCFNFYHRIGCTLSMSDETYLQFKISRQWACSSCTPTIPSVNTCTAIKIQQPSTLRSLFFKGESVINRLQHFSCTIV